VITTIAPASGESSAFWLTTRERYLDDAIGGRRTTRRQAGPWTAGSARWTAGSINSTLVADGRIDRLEARIHGRFETLQSSIEAMRSDLTQVALAWV
jgi:hypothetical protein